MSKKVIVKINKKGYEVFSREYFVEMGKIGGAAGTGKSKIRSTTFKPGHKYVGLPAKINRKVSETVG
jgi:hypothetical protein